METTLTERDLEELSEPARSTAFEFLWLLRESGYSDDLALRLALRGACEADADAAAPEPEPSPAGRRR
jgi:hypothetical protein